MKKFFIFVIVTLFMSFASAAENVRGALNDEIFQDGFRTEGLSETRLAILNWRAAVIAKYYRDFYGFVPSFQLHLVESRRSLSDPNEIIPPSKPLPEKIAELKKFITSLPPNAVPKDAFTKEDLHERDGEPLLNAINMSESAVGAMRESPLKAVLFHDLPVLESERIFLKRTAWTWEQYEKTRRNEDLKKDSRLSDASYRQRARELMNRILQVQRQAIGNQEYTTNVNISSLINYHTGGIIKDSNQVNEFLMALDKDYKWLSEAGRQKFESKIKAVYDKRDAIPWMGKHIDTLSDDEFIRQNEALLREIQDIRDEIAKSED